MFLYTNSFLLHSQTQGEVSITNNCGGNLKIYNTAVSFLPSILKPSSNFKFSVSAVANDNISTYKLLLRLYFNNNYISGNSKSFVNSFTKGQYLNYSFEDLIPSRLSSGVYSLKLYIINSSGQFFSCAMASFEY